MAFNMLGLRFEDHYDDADRLLEDMQKAAKKTSNILYRGISRAKEKYPILMRVWNGEKTVNLYRREFPMLRQFRLESASLIQTYSALDLVCAAQHFGIPTRLVDWTYSPFVALFFSLIAKPAEEEGFGYRIILCDKREQIVLPDIYSQQTYFQASYGASDRRIEMFEGFIELLNEPAVASDHGSISGIKALCQRAGIADYETKLNRFIVLEAGNANPRVSAQKGLFVIPRRLSEESIDSEYANAGAKTITISQTVRKEVLAQLENLGYSRLHLFFDLQNICQYIKEAALGN